MSPCAYVRPHGIAMCIMSSSLKSKPRGKHKREVLVDGNSNLADHRPKCIPISRTDSVMLEIVPLLRYSSVRSHAQQRPSSNTCSVLLSLPSPWYPSVGDKSPVRLTRELYQVRPRDSRSSHFRGALSSRTRLRCFLILCLLPTKNTVPAPRRAGKAYHTCRRPPPTAMLLSRLTRPYSFGPRPSLCPRRWPSPIRNKEESPFALVAYISDVMRVRQQ
ncbi:hypothetical protein C8Q78DRAFT_517540 [Trametes maxima]|nr:hypothetical protein C8Q78DRAFT_517540 [Trametes maxima]